MSEELLKAATLRLLQMHFDAGVGHIGGNLSVLPILLELFHDLQVDPERLVLSKGHAAGAIYIALWTKGILSEDHLRSFHRDGTLLAGHPPAKGVPGIAFATGSLGHGLALANGLAIAERLKGTSRQIFCVTSDGEWNEGSMWESLIFAAHQKLENLCIIIDVNGLQGFGTTREVADLEPMADRFLAFNTHVASIDATEYGRLLKVLHDMPRGKPKVILARTIKGRGVSFMQNRMEWHYLPMTTEQYALARQEVGG